MAGPKIAVIFYSLYSHCLTLAEKAVKSITEADSTAEVKLFQVPETLSKEILEKMHAAPRREDIPVITPDELTNWDAYVFVIPTRYGRAVSQFSSFFDATGGLWMKQSLAGKYATVIASTGTQNGGQETTTLTTLPFFTHHGIVYVPVGYLDANMTQFNEIKGGSPWGSGTLAASDGSRQPSEMELNSVAIHTKHFASIVAQTTRGAQRLAKEKEPGASLPKAVAEHQKDPTNASTSSVESTDSKKKKKGSRFSVHGITKGVKKLFT
ncbi:benzoquinone reductase [Tulasnella calospora MUT 4182]|uniref:Benzoquinone reductase n=1 Tax=Tulasnella calospora MUT 4182 TaxID=1051891 RepID=A0A0C3LZQ8_9AGAM|nr:benzoquinone reductase [Tulasnella calospora MUT 4182]